MTYTEMCQRLKPLGGLKRVGVDEIIVGGDLVPGPMPAEAPGLLRALDRPAKFIYGNGEVAVVDELAARKPRPGGISPHYSMERTQNQLYSNDQQMLSAWPKKVQLHAAGIGVSGVNSGRVGMPGACGSDDPQN